MGGRTVCDCVLTCRATYHQFRAVRQLFRAVGKNERGIIRYHKFTCGSILVVYKGQESTAYIYPKTTETLRIWLGYRSSKEDLWLDNALLWPFGYLGMTGCAKPAVRQERRKCFRQ